MTTIFKSSALWQFAGGFVLGAIGLAALHPSEAPAQRAAAVAATTGAAATGAVQR